MGMRSLIARSAERVAKAFGPGVPGSFQQGEQVSQMTPASPFSPGTPIGPYEGYDRVPRTRDFETGYNIATRPRIHERVSFDTLKGLIGAYDVASICIWHRIDSIRSLDWKLVSADHFSGDVTDAIPLGLAALYKPDREHYFDTWLAKWLYDVLAYDAPALYRLRNRGGRAVGLLPVDGTLIAPLLDYWGRSPEAPAEAYVQYVNGLPWNWLTRNDLIYEPFRPHNGSVYGQAPVETIILNANTDIRFQLYFLQRYTEGNIPAAFAASPETWSPDQIEQFQEYWDSFMYGDQSRKHQIRWMPGGSKIAWSNEKDFSDVFSLFMMRKTCSAFHVVPADLGYTENVNRSSGESQADVQHRVGDLPLIRYIQRIISGFLQDDLLLPLKFAFDVGEEQDDRLAQAQADDIYIKNGTVSPSYIGEIRFGRSDARPVPRFIFTERSGPIPLNSLEAVAGPVDPQTAAPALDAALPRTVFEEAPGVEPNPPLYGQPLAEEIYGPKAIPAHTETQSAEPVRKEGEGGSGPAPGITSETGLYSYDLVRGDEDEDEDGKRGAAVKSELAAFQRFARARRKNGAWRDFTFAAVPSVHAHNLNDAGRLAVRKAAGEVAVAGLAVLAADTGRVLMLQRALCDDDPAAGKLEFPGGHIEGDESPLAAAWREWAEESHAVPPPGEKTGEWTSPDGIYRGIVWTAESEASVPVRGEAFVPNPDDPDGDAVEAIMWVDPADLAGNPIVRPELAADLDVVMAALGCGGATPSEGVEAACPCGIPVVYDEGNGWQHGDGSISHDDGESVSGKMGQKVSKASVGYRPADGGQCCGNCSMIRQAGDGWSCTLVEGPVDPGAVCDRWDPADTDEVAKAGDAAPKAPTLHLPTLTGVWGDIYARREKLLAKYAKAVAAAWDECIAELGSPREVVQQFRSKAGLVAKLANPEKPWWKDAGTAAALAWLLRLSKTKGYPALVAALAGAIRSGMAEGEADALALAADRQGAAGFRIDRAFKAAYDRLAGDAEAAQQAQDAAAGMTDGAAGDIGRVLADQAEADGSEQDMADAAAGALAGDVSQSVGLGTDWALWAGIGAGALAFYQSIGTGGTGGNAADIASLIWTTASDGRVCFACQSNEDNSPYTISNAPDLPAHPRCRCSWDWAGSVAPSFLDGFLS